MSTSIVSLLRQLGLVAVPAPCVLIVDDEAGAARYVRRVLSAKGYETVVASSGEAALDIALRLERLDLLVTVVSMPGIGGDELAKPFTVAALASVVRRVLDAPAKLRHV